MGQVGLAGWSEHARPPLRVLHSLLESLHQVLATDFQFARQNTFALIGKIHRKDGLGFNAAAGAVGLQEALLTLMPSQAVIAPLNSPVCAQIACPGPGLGGLLPSTGRREGRCRERGCHSPQPTARSPQPAVTVLPGRAVQGVPEVCVGLP